MRDATKSDSLVGFFNIISIHASHAGRDFSASMHFHLLKISIHASHAGRDIFARKNRLCESNFNPRVPCGTRHMATPRQCMHCHFNPRVPCGTRPESCVKAIGLTKFQSTRPMRDATCMLPSLAQTLENFNPRVPCGTRLTQLVVLLFHFNFNPRVPCGTRLLRTNRIPPHYHFNPRVPCGTRLMALAALFAPDSFQSTRPMRDATL